MLKELKSALYKLKRNIQKTKEMTNFAKSLSGTWSHGDVTFEEAFQSLVRYKAFQPSQIKSEIKYLFEKVKTDQPKVICEIGSLKGGTLYLLSQAAPNDALIISIDICYPSVRKHAHKHLIKNGQQLICIEGDTQNPKTLSRVAKVLKGRNVDFLFIDGDHSLFGVMNDYVRFIPFIKSGGLIAFHDINPDMQMRTGIKSSSFVGGVPIFWKTIKNFGLGFEEIIENPDQDGFGIGIFRKE